MRTVIYARFSSDNQNPRSIADQLAMCRDRAAKEGWTIVAAFEDAATSGAAGIGEEQRPGLNAMLGMVEAGDIDQVLAESTDRVARHVADAHIIRERIEFAGARLFTLFDGTVTPMIGLVKGFMDAQFRTDLAARIKRGQRGMVKEGRAPGGVSYGYRRANRLVDGDIVRGLREIDEEQAAIVRRIFQEYASGQSPRAIAGRLNAESIATPRGRGYWHSTTIGGEAGKGMGILRNRLYIGELTYGRTRVATNPTTRKKIFRTNRDEPRTVQPVPHLRIIDDELWARVEDRQAENVGVRPERRRRPKHLLSGLGKCGVCGSSIVIGANSNWNCGRFRMGGDCANNRYIATRKYERMVLAELKREMLAPDLVAEYVREYHREFARKSATLGRDRGRLERQLGEATRKMDRMLDAFAQGGNEFAEIREMLGKARAEKDRLTRELASMDAVPVLALHPRLADDYRREVEQLEAALTGNPGQALETIPRMRAMIARVIVSPNPTGRGAIVEVIRQLDEVLALATGQSTRSIANAQ